MSVKIGDKGGIRIAPESVAYGTAGTVWTVQHARSASLGERKGLLPKATLGLTNPTTRAYGIPYADGEIEIAYDDSRAVIGPLLAAAGNLVTNDYTIGDGSAPDTNSLTMWIDYGGYAVQHLGCKLASLRFAFEPDSPIVVTAGFIGRSAAPQTPATLTYPAASGIVWDSDISAVSVGGANQCTLSGSIEVQFPFTDTSRHCLGASEIKEPQMQGGVIAVTASLQVELNDETGDDSEAILADYFSETALGDIVIGDFTLSDCYMVGDPPALGEGITSFPVNVEASTLVITTTV